MKKCRIIAKSDTSYQNKYLDRLIDLISDKIEDRVDEFYFKKSEDTLDLTVNYMDRLFQISITYDDLEFNFNEIDSDAEYFSDCVFYELDNLY